MKFFSAFGFDIIEIDETNKKQAYDILEVVLVRKNQNYTLVARDKRILLNNINYTIKTNFYYGVGLVKNDEWVGVCLCNDSDKMAWIGNLVIKEEFRKTKAVVVMMHFLLNILFKKENVSVGPKNTEQFEKHLLEPSNQLKFRVFDPKSKIRFKNIIEKDKA